VPQTEIMKYYKYKLEPYDGQKSRYICPLCNDVKKTFTRYIDTLTGQYISDLVGKCNREVNCKYHYPPLKYFTDNKIESNIKMSKFTSLKVDIVNKRSRIPNEKLEQTLKGYENNKLVEFMCRKIDIQSTVEAIEKYKIGTSKKWDGATVFWQIDESNSIRTGKIMLYNPNNGKRVKEPYNHITWVHSELGYNDYQVNQCLFGQHLINENDLPIAIVESEKKAVIASTYLKSYLWLATGGLNNLKPSKIYKLQNRNITLFPDLNSYDKWFKTMGMLSKIANVSISYLLEERATDEEKLLGLDIADYLIKNN
jgi:hypothetical protein